MREQLEGSKQWALCHRRAAGIDTNMYTESFPRVLKYVYMKGKVNKRTDSIIHILMRYVGDKACDRLTSGKREKHK